MTEPADVTYAVGDVHGQADLLFALQATIMADARRRGARSPKVVYLGDAVDRGPNPREAIDLQIDGLPGFSKVRLRGNHEDLMLGFLDNPLGDEAYTWITNGGEATLRGYGIKHDGLGDIAARAAGIRSEFEAALGPRHLAHLRSLAVHHETPEAIFVHAGLRPGVALEDQDSHDMMWIRGAFLESDHDWGKPVVHGHTPSQYGPEILPNRVNLDTLAYGTGFLTAGVFVPGEAPRFLVSGRPRDWQLIVDPDGTGSDTWLSWALDAAISSNVRAVGICSPSGGRLAEMCSTRGLRVKPVSIAALATLDADPKSDLSRGISADRATLCFPSRAARETYRMAVRESQRMAREAASPSPR